MSGGHFDYYQWHIGEIAEKIENLIQINDSEELDEFGDRVGYGFSEETIERFRNAVIFLKIAAAYAQRIDWLVCGDDGEETFHKRLAEDLEEIKEAE